MKDEILDDELLIIDEKETKQKKSLASEDTYFNLHKLTDDFNKKEEKEKNKEPLKPDKEPKDKKEKRKLRKGEKVFLLLNILVILGIIGIYAYRAYYYYKQSREIDGEVVLKDKLTALDNLEYQNDGLYEKDHYFYYKGVNVNNYVYYSGRMFRIIDIDDGIRMIDDETSTNLVYGVDTLYNDSNIYNWLKNYVNTLKDYEVYLQKNNWCVDKIDVNNYQCKGVINDYVGLLSTSDYLQAGGKNSYLNNNTYFWTLNVDKDNKPLYINNEGGINNIVAVDDNYYSYGIRPVITLKADVSIIEGTGTKEDPFIIENLGKALLKDNSTGNYVKYHNQDFRILSIDDDGITLMSNNSLEVEKSYKEALTYLNNEYLKDFDKSELVLMKDYINEYNFDNQYDYSTEKEEISHYVTLPKIGDLFLNMEKNYWLNTINDSKLGLYYVVDENNMFFGDLQGNKHFIRPVIKLNIDTVVSTGLGTMEEPLVIGENNVE